ncbi:MAG: Uma2 family endonuclease, partial [Pirellulales bacterium]
KQRLYAAAGVREYWVVNLIDDQIEVYQLPIVTERRYARRSVYKLGDAVILNMTPDAPIELRVDELIPPRP